MFSYRWRFWKTRREGNHAWSLLTHPHMSLTFKESNIISNNTLTQECYGAWLTNRKWATRIKKFLEHCATSFVPPLTMVYDLPASFPTLPTLWKMKNKGLHLMHYMDGNHMMHYKSHDGWKGRVAECYWMLCACMGINDFYFQLKIAQLLHLKYSGH